MLYRGRFPAPARKNSYLYRRCGCRWRRRLPWNSWELQYLSAGPAGTPFAAGSAAGPAVAFWQDPERVAGDLDSAVLRGPSPLQVLQPAPASGYAAISLPYGVPPPTLDYTPAIPGQAPMLLL